MSEEIKESNPEAGKGLKQKVEKVEAVKVVKPKEVKAKEPKAKIKITRKFEQGSRGAMMRHSLMKELINHMVKDGSVKFESKVGKDGSVVMSVSL